MSNGRSFSAQVKNWTEKAKRNSALVFRAATRDLVNEVFFEVGKEAGLTPIDTGNLRNSLMASTASMPSVKTVKGEQYPWKDHNPTPDLTMTIDGATLGKTIFIGFQANYARPLEYGFTKENPDGTATNRPGRYFVRGRAEKWQQFVDNAAKEVGG